jgi:hypothetical protein
MVSDKLFIKDITAHVKDIMRIIHKTGDKRGDMCIKDTVST